MVSREKGGGEREGVFSLTIDRGKNCFGKIPPS